MVAAQSSSLLPLFLLLFLDMLFLTCVGQPLQIYIQLDGLSAARVSRQLASARRRRRLLMLLLFEDGLEDDGRFLAL